MKFIMFMYICSHIEGNECKPIAIPTQNFNTYFECAVYGYDYSSILLREFNTNFINEYKVYTIFDCKEITET